MKRILYPVTALLMALSCNSSAQTPKEEVKEPEKAPVSLTMPEIKAPAGSALAGKSTLTKAEAEAYAAELASVWKASVKEQGESQFEAKALHIGKNVMRIWWATYGSKPAGGRSLYISLHGGGGAAPSVNDQQWNNQKQLYKPDEGVYLAPRAITNTWDLHFVPEADAFYEAIIRYAVAAWDVNPDRVYIMGYSAGGDGVWRLGPRMADHWAAASMMAGHPGDVRLESLRNTPFMIWCGALDAAYDRNKECAERIKVMDALQADDPEGYIHEGHIVEGKEHWMDLVDAAAVPWMARYTRNPNPSKVVWVQGDVMKPAFYWLGVDASAAHKGDMLTASVKDNTVTIEKSDYGRVTVYLNDTLVNLDQPVKVVSGEKVLFEGTLTRSPQTMLQTLNSRGDLSYVYPAMVEVSL